MESEPVRYYCGAVKRMNNENLRFDGDYFENADEYSIPNTKCDFQSHLCCRLSDGLVSGRGGGKMCQWRNGTHLAPTQTQGTVEERKLDVNHPGKKTKSINNCYCWQPVPIAYCAIHFLRNGAFVRKESS